MFHPAVYIAVWELIELTMVRRVQRPFKVTHIWAIMSIITVTHSKYGLLHHTHIAAWQMLHVGQFMSHNKCDTACETSCIYTFCGSGVCHV